MKKFISLLFVPQPGNDHRALLLQPSFFGIFIAVYLLNQSLIRSLTVLKPGVLGYSSEITIQKVVDSTNQERRKAGLPDLKFNPVLSKSAQLKAYDMFSSNYWAHNSPQGKTPWDFFKQSGYQYSVAGENLAKDFYDTESMMGAWMKSPTHKANIVSDKYQEIGIAVVNGVLNGVKTTLVVQHFGTPLNIPVTSRQQVSGEYSPQAVSQPQQAVTPGPTTKSISPLMISKAIGLFMFVVIISVLLVDAYITLKTDTRRLAGSSAGHIGFLAIILLLMLFTRQGTIF